MLVFLNDRIKKKCLRVKKIKQQKAPFLNKVLYLTNSFPVQGQITQLKLLELLLGSSSLCHFEDIKPHSLAEWSALSNSYDVSN